MTELRSYRMICELLQLPLESSDTWYEEFELHASSREAAYELLKEHLAVRKLHIVHNQWLPLIKASRHLYQ